MLNRGTRVDVDVEAKRNCLDLLLDIIDENWQSLVISFADLWNTPWTLFPDERDGYELSWLEKGSGTLTVQNRKYAMKSGDFILVHSAEGNQFIPDEEDFWILQTTFVFNRIENRKRIDCLHRRIREESFPWNISDGSGIAELMHQMNRIITTAAQDRNIRLKALLLNVILTANRFRQDNPASQSARKYDQNLRFMIDSVEMHIIRNFSRKISISELAKIASVTPQYLCGRFKLVTGKSIVEYINGYRIHKSKRLLLYSNLSVTTIAQDVGFCNSQYFCRVFARSENMTPSQFRKSMRNGY